MVLAQIGAVLWDEKVFPEAQKFKPERFIDSSGGLKKCEQLIPFGVGKRSCLGESLARMELFIMFVTIMQKFDFKPLDKNQLPTLKAKTGFLRSCQNYQCYAVEE